MLRTFRPSNYLPVHNAKLARPKGSICLLDIAIAFLFFLANDLGVDELPCGFLNLSRTLAINHGSSSASIIPSHSSLHASLSSLTTLTTSTSFFEVKQLFSNTAEMLSRASIPFLCLANLAHAHSGRFQPRADPQECCPCPGPNEKPNGGPATVTVTEAAPAVTVTEASAPAADPVTVYISTAGGDQAEKPAPTPETVTVHSTVVESAATVYVTLANAAEPSPESSDPKVIDVTVQPGPQQETVKAEPGSQPETVIVKPGSQPGTVTVQPLPQPQTVTVQPGSQPETVTVHADGPKGTDATVIVAPGKDDSKPAADAAASDENTTVTQTILPAGASPETVLPTDAAAPEGPKTVTVNVAPAPAQDKPVTAIVDPAQDKTVIAVVSSTPCPSSSNVVTVTAVPEGAASPDAPEDIKNKGLVAEPKTVIVKQEPSVKTVTVNGEVKTETAMIPSTITITAPPSAETMGPAGNADQFTTIIQSIHNGDNNDIDIQINIININTGEVVCKKEGTGEPCDGDNVKLDTVVVLPPAPTTTPNPSDPCPAVTNSTTIATAFNTVTVTVKQGWAGNSTDAGASSPTGSMGLPARVPRGPLSAIRW